MERCRKLERGLLASKSEQLPPNDAQLSLGVLVDGARRAAAGRARRGARGGEGRARKSKAHTRRKPTGRKPLPEYLPRVEITVLPPEVEKKGLDAFERIGEDISETIERRPASHGRRARHPPEVRAEGSRARTA